MTVFTSDASDKWGAQITHTTAQLPTKFGGIPQPRPQIIP